jgi:hypothetical protein
VLLGCATEDKLAASNRLFPREFLGSDEQEHHNALSPLTTS